MTDRIQAIARAWAFTDWGDIPGGIPDGISVDGYLEDAPDFIRHLNEQGFDIVPLVPHEGIVT